jgi:hypothetical protein
MLPKVNAGLIVGVLSVALSMNAQATSEDTKLGHENMQQADSMDHQKMHEQHMQQMRSGDMPMMGGGCNKMGGCNHMMNDRPMPDHMMQMRQQRMWQGPQGGMPMMDPQRRDYMMQMRQHRMQNMNQRGMMKEDMMKQEMKQMRKQHMKNMEERLANIEKLLGELVELQKK